MACVCTKKCVKSDERKQIGKMIDVILVAKKGSKAKIKLEIELSD